MSFAKAIATLQWADGEEQQFMCMWCDGGHIRDDCAHAAIVAAYLQKIDTCALQRAFITDGHTEKTLHFDRTTHACCTHPKPQLSCTS